MVNHTQAVHWAVVQILNHPQAVLCLINPKNVLSCKWSLQEALVYCNQQELFYEAAQAFSFFITTYATVENADEPSTRAVKVWSDPLNAKDRSGELRRRKKGVCARNQISEDWIVFLGISLIFTLDRVAQIWLKLKQELLCNGPRGNCIVESCQEEG